VFIKKLKIKGFRCYKTIDLIFDKRINILFGDNGVGKTTVLEAIYWLSTGKSFRSKKNKILINHNENEFVLYIDFNNGIDHSNHSLGISLHKSKRKQIKLNQQALNNHSHVAHQIPVVSIDPDSYLFIDKPPQYRRSFLDWLVFHVKPNYLNIWAHTMRCHKQLNVLYKAKNKAELIEWEKQYIKYGEQLNTDRRTTFALLKSKLIEKVNFFIPELVDFNIEFSQGWVNGISLAESISQERDKNLLYGVMYSGVHKMDIRCKVNKSDAQEVCSRGQKKLISILFYLSFIELIAEFTGLAPIVCLDDMDAELDVNKTNLMCDFIRLSENQVFISTVDPKKITTLFDDASVFHVKQNRTIEQLN
jgi:DNA replication and repair protein RecF